jgi:hypothetical protein
MSGMYSDPHRKKNSIKKTGFLADILEHRRKTLLLWIIYLFR